LSFSVFIQDFRSCQVIAVHLLLASNVLLLQMFCFWQVTPCSSSIHGHSPRIDIRVLVSDPDLVSIKSIFGRFFFSRRSKARFAEGGVFVYGVGTTPGEGGDRGSGEKNVKSKRRGNVMERSSPGARECHELRNYVAKQLKRERWLRPGRNVKISRFSKILFSIVVGARSPCRPQISSFLLIPSMGFTPHVHAA
jgi:hypothetical protein